MNVVLISTYELGRQSFGIASPSVWLKDVGACVDCLDLSVEALDQTAVNLLEAASLIAFHLPMHTATRLAVPLLKKIKEEINPTAHICCYGLYAPLNEDYLHKLGADSIIGGEFEAGLVTIFKRLEDKTSHIEADVPSISLSRQKFRIPDREGLPDLSKYARLNRGGDGWDVVGYTEASRGCKHKCRHCPIVPVYEGRFRIIQKEIVLADIQRQVDAGATHITFGDPDFFNGPGHAIPLVTEFHKRFPQVTYDVTIKIEHLLKCAQHLPTLRETGCLFITSAVEAVDDKTLQMLDKGHTKQDFIKVVDLFRRNNLTLIPTFVAFTPWTTVESYQNLLKTIYELKLVDNVAPIQLAIRLLLPRGSKLLNLPEVRAIIGDFEESSLVYPWIHPDPVVDKLHQTIFECVKEGQSRDKSRRQIFADIWEIAFRTEDVNRLLTPELHYPLASNPVPFLSESWYC